MQPPFSLAPSVWPRFGVNLANQGRSSVRGPRRGAVVARVKLPHADGRIRCPKGAIACDDGSFRVACERYLSALNPDFSVAWSLPLLERDGGAAREHSLPTAIAGGGAFLTLGASMVVADSRGQVALRVDAPLVRERHGHASLSGASRQLGLLEGSGFSHNLTRDGRPIVTTTDDGTVAWLGDDGQWQVVGYFGYDVPAPAVFRDGSLGISGYAHRGYCRAGLDGREIWNTSLSDADTIAVLSDDEVSAVGSLNDEITCFFEADGTKIAEYPRVAICTSLADGGWIASSAFQVERLDSAGRLLWGTRVCEQVDEDHPSHRFGANQAPVDVEGCIFVETYGRLLALSPDGEPLFTVGLPDGLPGPVSIVREGLAAVVVGTELLVIS